jgi:cysteine synthase
VPGGTKRRVIGGMLAGAAEVVYASPACGYAQVALAHEAAAHGVAATVFTAKRNVLHARTREAQAAGARIVLVPHGYLSNVQAKARSYAAQTGARYLPFGLDTEPFLEALAGVARALPVVPAEVWSVAGSGTLSRALQRAWPDAAFFAVQVGSKPNVGHATLLHAPERFEQDARVPPPFQSCGNYDAKAWRFVRERASPGALFWNVAR